MTAGAALEPAPGVSHEAAVKTAFVRAVIRHLPADARAELNATDDTEEAVRAWARRWHVDCPPVVEWGRGEVKVRILSGGRFRTTNLGFGYDVPEGWWELLAELNATTLHANGSDPRDVGKARDVGITIAPIAANPLAESRNTFLRRAASHWGARAALARDRGFTSIAPLRDLQTHCDWLARYQMLGETPAAIAATPGREVSEIAVKRALERLRKVLGLSSRRGPGRPKK